MRWVIGSLKLLTVMLPGRIYAQNSMLTVCEVLDHRLQYDGKTVVVFGRISLTTEGTWLTEDCGAKLAIDGVEWGYDISLSYVAAQTIATARLAAGFRWNRQKLIAALPTKTDSTQWSDDADCQHRTGWSAVFGRFETKKGFDTFRDASGAMQHIGFGHLGDLPHNSSGQKAESSAWLRGTTNLERQASTRLGICGIRSDKLS